MVQSLFRFIASVKLAVLLIVVLAAVLSVATILEAGQGREFTQWYVYGSTWFIALLALLGVNILAAALIRWPWKKQQTGFVVTHAGLLVLLAGAVQTFMFGSEGQVILQEGQRSDQMLLTGRSVITAIRHTSDGRKSSKFSFRPGPSDWASSAALDFGVVDGFGLKVLRFLRHAEEKTQWVAADDDYDGAALHLALSGPGGSLMKDQWLTANRYGGQAVIGPTMYVLLPIFHKSLEEDFLDPPSGDFGEAGILSIHFEGKVQRVRVDDHLGKRIPVGDGGIEVEIAEFLANAKPTPDGRFVSPTDAAKNPLLELRIHQPGDDQPLRQIALAKEPLLNLDSVNKRSCPVKFWYHHPAAQPLPGAVFMQTTDEKLFCRTVMDGVVSEPRQVEPGQTVDIGRQFKITVKEYLPRARQETNFTRVDIAPGDDGPEAAALIELVDGDRRRQLWLKRRDPLLGTQTVRTEQGRVTLTFDYDRQPLGYVVQLEDFQRKKNPGEEGDAAFSSSIRLIDQEAGLDDEHVVSMNQPLSHGDFTLYQSSFQDGGHGRETSIFTAAYDPGRFLKYAGSLMICGGIFIMFYMRSYFFQSVPRVLGWSRRNDARSITADSEHETERDGEETDAAQPIRPRKRVA